MPRQETLRSQAMDRKSEMSLPFEIEGVCGNFGRQTGNVRRLKVAELRQVRNAAGDRGRDPEPKERSGLGKYVASGRVQKDTPMRRVLSMEAA